MIDLGINSTEISYHIFIMANLLDLTAQCSNLNIEKYLKNKYVIQYMPLNFLKFCICSKIISKYWLKPLAFPKLHFFQTFIKSIKIHNLFQYCVRFMWIEKLRQFISQNPPHYLYNSPKNSKTTYKRTAKHAWQAQAGSF